jgi:cobalt-zinc-cadmium resistance protein CzcA
VLEAVREVAVPTTAGIVIIALVFVPLLSLQGLEGKLFAPVALTIVFALAGSLLLSLTVIPLLARLMLNARSHADPWLPRTLSRLYRPLLQRALAAPRIVAAIAALLFAVAAVVYLSGWARPSCRPWTKAVSSCSWRSCRPSASMPRWTSIPASRRR